MSRTRRAVKQAVAGGRVAVHEEDVTGLLAAEGGADLEHLFEDVFVADTGAQHFDAAGVQSFFQAHVAHGGGDDGVVGEDAAGFHIAGGDEEDGVSVDDVAEGVAEEGAVGVAIEGDADVEVAGAALHLGGDVLRVQGSAAVVDVAAGGRGVQSFGRDADAGKKFGSDGAGGSVGAVDEDAERLELRGLYASGKPVFVVGAQGGIAGENAGHEAAFVVFVIDELVDVLEDFGFDFVFDLIGEFHAVAAEELDAVILPGIVGGRDDDSGGKAVGAGEIGYAGSGEHSGADEAASGIAQAARDGFCDPAAGFAGVLPEYDLGVGRTAHETRTAGASNGVDRSAIEGIFTGDAANAVGSKQLPDDGAGNSQVKGLQLLKMISAH